MKKLIILAIFSVVLCLANGADNNSKAAIKDVGPEPLPPTDAPSTTPSHSTTTQSPNSTTTPSSTTKSTTPLTTPTTPSTTPTIPSTTPTPSTTPASNTTTAAPTTPPTPTIKPTPKPKPEVNTWSANFTGTNRTCIVVKMILKIEVPYNKTDNHMANATIVVPTTAVATGICENNPNATEQSLTLTWKEGNVSDSVVLTFKKNNTKFALHSVIAQIIPDVVNFPNASNNNSIVANHTKDEFLTPVAMSYRCKQDEFLPVHMSMNKTGKFIVSNLQIQAFRNVTGDNFDSAKDCESGETPGIVPIAVGCSLAALIIIVLVAYLVGRRRSQARGYLSISGSDDEDEESASRRQQYANTNSKLATRTYWAICESA